MNIWHRLYLIYAYSDKMSLSQLLLAASDDKTDAKSKLSALSSMDNETLLSRLEEKFLPDAEEPCPVCGNHMKDHSWSSSGYDNDNEWNTWNETVLVCHKCGTKKQNDTWYIPDAYKASEKQFHAAAYIHIVTGLPLPPPTKKLLWKFINENLQAAKNIKQKQHETDMEQFCEEFPEFIPAYDDLC